MKIAAWIQGYLIQYNIASNTGKIYPQNVLNFETKISSIDTAIGGIRRNERMIRIGFVIEDMFQGIEIDTTNQKYCLK